MERFEPRSISSLPELGGVFVQFRLNVVLKKKKNCGVSEICLVWLSR